MIKPLQQFASFDDRPPLFPPAVSAFLRNRLIDAAGAALITTASLMILACWSYTPSDPSLNTATDSIVARNILGIKGAYFADFMVQGFGLACYIPAIILAGWGLRVVLRLPVPHVLLRLAGASVVTLFGAAALSALPSSPTTPLTGGAAGVILLDGIRGLMPGAWHNFSNLWAIGLATVVATIIFFPVMGYAYSEWVRGLRRTHRRILYAGRVMASFPMWMVDTLRHPQERRPLLIARDWDEEREQESQDTEKEEAFFDEETDENSETESIDGENTPTDSAPRKKNPLVSIGSRIKKTTAYANRRRSRFSNADRSRVVELNDGELYELPSLDILSIPEDVHIKKMTSEQLAENAETLMSALNDYGVDGRIIKASPGPVVTLYELEPAPGTKSARIIGLSDDIARQVSALSVRVSTVPGRNVLGIELPNNERETVFLRELLSHASYTRTTAKLPLSLGKDISGEPVVADLARMPHLLVAGTTGSGKSVSINTMILSLLYRMTPEQVRLIMIDPKMLELSVYEGIPHLLAPVVTDPKKAVVALKWTVREMEDRYRAMSKLGVRNIDGYNQRIREAHKNGEVLSRRVQTGFDADTGKPVFEEQPIDLVEIPYIVVIVDEMADLMLVAGKDIEAAIQRLAQMARAAGIHLIMATQRPSVDVITGTIKANFPTRISFQVTSRIDSRTILNEQGAEQLLGQGDMLYMAGGGRITRIHGSYASDHEVEEVVRHLRTQGEPSYLEAITTDSESSSDGFGADGEGGESDDLYDRAVQIVLRERKASTSYIQRCLQIGYNRAARLVERMESEGLVSPANHVGKREILVPGESAR